ncbi:peptide deformylase [Candidatus Marinamargulisbacteria bacterium SCGC AG-333-B06]|nr:peptide deformylase [Candidatus Marinamargulisbacteria bacterium SCGC AG-333-B06]
MSVLDVIEVPNNILSQTAEDVFDFDDGLTGLVNDLFDTMVAYKGLGLAAPQVGVLKRLFVCQYQNQRLVCINPTIDVSGDSLDSEEGCLSIPNILATVTRYPYVTVKASDVNGNLFTESFDGMMAIVVQHEQDHLNGVLITDKALKTRYQHDQTDTIDKD